MTAINTDNIGNAANSRSSLPATTFRTWRINMTIMSWQTYKKRFNPTICSCPDGVLPITYAIAPTLVNDGLQFIGNFAAYELHQKPKEIAKDIYEEFMMSSQVKPKAQIVVYYVSEGSRVNSMPRIVNVYMGLKKESEVTK